MHQHNFNISIWNLIELEEGIKRAVIGYLDWKFQELPFPEDHRVEKNFKRGTGVGYSTTGPH
jgi:hypothetical protein